MKELYPEIDAERAGTGEELSDNPQVQAAYLGGL
ncbi:MAG: hypothetical protein E7240_02460 [Lachnospiraceae bacterium]|nr:hypothetical protein [Lachnospiraceae bacterium]